jgi:hypothetical protein
MRIASMRAVWNFRQATERGVLNDDDVQLHFLLHTEVSAYRSIQMVAEVPDREEPAHPLLNL